MRKAIFFAILVTWLVVSLVPALSLTSLTGMGRKR